MAEGSSIDIEPVDDGAEVWRAKVRQPEVMAAVAVLHAPYLTVLEPRSMREEIRAGARRALDHCA